MLHVEIENILSEEDAVAKARDLIDRVDVEKLLVVITRQNRPAVAMIDVPTLEALTGKTVTPVAPSSTVLDHLKSLDETPPVDEAPPVIEPMVATEPILPDMPETYVTPTYNAEPATQPVYEPVIVPVVEPVQQPQELPAEPVFAEPLPQMPQAPAYLPQQVATPVADALPDMPEDPTNGSPLA